METLKFTKLLITPSIAKQLIEQNINNRRINNPLLIRYSDDMLKGRWKDNTGETIKIAKTGRILDGQHRLHAVIRSGKSIYFYVATELDEDVFDVIDTGKQRSAFDVFTISQIKNSNIIPSVIAQFNLLEDQKKQGTQLNMKKTNAGLLEQYYEDEQFWQNVGRSAINWYNSFAKILTPSFIGGFYAHFYQLNQDKAISFMNELCTGSNVSNETINLLRNKLMQDKMSQRKMPSTLKMALMIKTWNHYIKGNEVKILKFDTIRDEFPKAIR